MISKARIYITEKGTAVPEGHKDARSLLVIEGGEISDSQLEKVKGAAELAKGEKAKANDSEAVDLSSLTKAELITLAYKQGVDSKGLNMTELIEALS